MARLAVYRCYRISKDNHFVDVAMLDAFNDAGAIAEAQSIAQRLGWSAYELWDQARKVITVVLQHDEDAAGSGSRDLPDRGLAAG